MEQLILLGTGDSMGVPRVYCDCAVCEEARTAGENRRFRSAALFSNQEGDLLIDCGPDFREQMELIGMRKVRHVLITHAHHDHIGGLPELADACRWTNEACRVYAPAVVIEEICGRYPWLNRQLTFQVIREHFSLLGWQVSCWQVNHGKNGISHAYKFSRPDKSWVYCPDSIALSEEEMRPMQGVDLLVLGTNFYKEQFPFATRSVYDIVEALALIRATVPKRVVFTHMSHGIDIRQDYRLPNHVKLGKVKQNLFA
ncbi:MAG TPA: MBL fold metallo-hydrolase [Bacilli bacterium]